MVVHEAVGYCQSRRDGFLGVMSTSVNIGALETVTQADGLSFKIRYSEKGPFAPQIQLQMANEKSLTRRAQKMGGGIRALECL